MFEKTDIEPDLAIAPQNILQNHYMSFVPLKVLSGAYNSWFSIPWQHTGMYVCVCTYTFCIIMIFVVQN